MNSKELHRAFRALRTLFVAVMALAGLILCLTVMHSLPVKHGTSEATVAATALAGHHEVQSPQGVGVLSSAASCQGICGQEHYVMATTCVVALLVPLLLVGVARITTSWRPLARRARYLLQRGGALPPLLPPSLLFLSISRT